MFGEVRKFKNSVGKKTKRVERPQQKGLSDHSPVDASTARFKKFYTRVSKRVWTTECNANSVVKLNVVAFELDACNYYCLKSSKGGFKKILFVQYK